MPSDTAINGLLAAKAPWDDILEAILARFDCVTGTIHSIDPATGKLQLIARRGIPDELLPVITTIPIGKGIAGAAAEKREAVALCNLQTDDTGVARPDAKKTRVAGSIAIPLERGEELRGALGIGKHVPYDFTEVEISALWDIGKRIATVL